MSKTVNDLILINESSGDSRLNLKDYMNAINDYTSALHDMPDRLDQDKRATADVYYKRGIANYAIKKYDVALTDYIKALNRMPEITDIQKKEKAEVLYKEGVARNTIKDHDGDDDIKKAIAWGYNPS